MANSDVKGCLAKGKHDRYSPKTENLLMFSRLTKIRRARAAIILAGAYALCVVSPSIALALAQGAAAAHCLSDDYHHIPASDKGDVSHPHHDIDVAGQGYDHDKVKSENCCGLFCVTVGAIPFARSLADSIQAAAMNVVIDDVLRGRPTDRIDRPPRSLLSL